MAAPLRLRGDYDAIRLRRLARLSEDAGQVRRLLALSAIYDGSSRTAAAGLAALVFKLCAIGYSPSMRKGPSGLIDGKASGNPPLLNADQRQALARILEAGPDAALHDVVRWRLMDLAQWIFEEFRIQISFQRLSRELRKMGYRKLSARPRHYA